MTFKILLKNLTVSALIQLTLVLVLYYFLGVFVAFYQPGFILTLPGFMVEYIGLLMALLAFFAVTNSIVYSLILINTVYLIFIIASLVKISYLSFPLVYYDLFQAGDLLLNLESINMLTLGLLIVLICFALVVLTFGVIKNKGYHNRFFSTAILLSLVVILNFNTSHVKKYLSSNNIKYKWNSNIYFKTQHHGLLTFFIQSLYFSNKLEKPVGYSLNQAKNYINDAAQFQPVFNQEANIVPDNVIVLMVESFQNIKQLPWKTNIEITPTYNKLESKGHSGNLVSPSFGGKSINAEFELLTGFSNVFTPAGSIPYKDFIHHKVPSIAWEFKQNEFTTNAIQVVKMKGYGYSSIYDHLGFDNKYSLSRSNENIELDPTERYGSSGEIATKISELINTQKKSFIFAFPNSSHSPWNIKDYPNNKIKLINNKLDSLESNEVIAYYNSMMHIDELFHELTMQINKDEKTLILIVGDHQPGLKPIRRVKKGNHSIIDKTSKHIVPYLFWSNYGAKLSSIDEKITSMNLIGLKLLRKAGIKPTGFYGFLEVVKNNFQAFSFVLMRNNELFSIDDIQSHETVRQYRFIQFMYLANDSK